jgi:PrtD family type I secretion system ABC transporter
MSRLPQQMAMARQAAVSEFAGSAIENSEVIHAMGMQADISQRFRTQVEAMGIEAQRAADRGAVITAISKALRVVVQVGVLGIGAYLVTKAELTPGGMIGSSIVLGRALAPVEQSIGSWRQFLNARSAFAEIKAFLSGISADDQRITLPEIEGRLTTEAVTYSHGGADRVVINKVSLALDPGSILAIIGPSASGKSSLCRLLVGAWAPTLGHVRLDGADVHALSLENVREAIGYLPQNVELFAGTVKENIARLGEVDEAAVVAASISAGCHDMILRLQDGYETQLGPQGSFLSGGQRQRIGLARALYGAPSLIVLDEPNANLDQEGETALVAALRDHKERGATIVVVTHRMNLLSPVDKIAVLREGRLERFGDRDEVLRELSPRAIPAAPRPAALADSGASSAGSGNS